MSSKRKLPVSYSSQEINTDSNVNKSESSSRSNTCRICGDTARIINYGALSCQSCKTFFRRNGFRPDSVRLCNFDKCCEINMQTRHTCTACRLAKCFMMGMSSDLIRKEDTKKLKRTSSLKQNSTTDQSTSQDITVHTVLQIVTSNTSNILHSDQSSHFDSQWTLLSNIVHSHDTFSTMSQMLITVNSLPALSGEAHSIVINPIEIINQMCISMQSFISSSPDFRILTLSEQTSLFERNLHCVIAFYSTLFFRHTGILRIPEYLNAFITIYGSDIMLSLRHTSEQLDPDPTLIKIILIILAFSSNCLIVNTNKTMERDSLLDGTFRLLGSQNVYVELLWKYLISKYGYDESALRFTRLIQIFLCVIKKLAIVYTNNAIHRKILDGVTARTKQILANNENDRTLLWGKGFVSQFQ
ncbi:unnamed protein product [Adineta steineri]|uniref:Nuclear receptor domain-containing protein n=1 Tax=Adineta steineri TaxID=433720 RepID=A0A813W3E6_9BILA|nr:unnamed protein product [Adineta steineri]CAF0849200.1 unnamed protein product [Adineta steineri]